MTRARERSVGGAETRRKPTWVERSGERGSKKRVERERSGSATP